MPTAIAPPAALAKDPPDDRIEVAMSDKYRQAIFLRDAAKDIDSAGCTILGIPEIFNSAMMSRMPRHTRKDGPGSRLQAHQRQTWRFQLRLHEQGALLHVGVGRNSARAFPRTGTIGCKDPPRIADQIHQPLGWLVLWIEPRALVLVDELLKFPVRKPAVAADIGLAVPDENYSDGIVFSAEPTPAHFQLFRSRRFHVPQTHH